MTKSEMLDTLRRGIVDAVRQQRTHAERIRYAEREMARMAVKQQRCLAEIDRLENGGKLEPSFDWETSAREDT